MHSRLATTVYETQLRKARLRGAFWASLDLVPNVAIAAILLIGALAVANQSLTTGGLVAFVALVLQLVWPIEAMGYILALGQEGATAAQRVYEILDTQPTITSTAGTARSWSAEESSPYPALTRTAIRPPRAEPRPIRLPGLG